MLILHQQAKCRENTRAFFDLTVCTAMPWFHFSPRPANKLEEWAWLASQKKSLQKIGGGSLGAKEVVGPVASSKKWSTWEWGRREAKVFRGGASRALWERQKVVALRSIEDRRRPYIFFLLIGLGSTCCSCSRRQRVTVSGGLLAQEY